MRGRAIFPVGPNLPYAPGSTLLPFGEDGEMSTRPPERRDPKKEKHTGLVATNELEMNVTPAGRSPAPLRAHTDAGQHQLRKA